jgi:hypothetical protein
MPPHHNLRYERIKVFLYASLLKACRLLTHFQLTGFLQRRDVSVSPVLHEPESPASTLPMTLQKV